MSLVLLASWVDLTVTAQNSKHDSDITDIAVILEKSLSTTPPDGESESAWLGYSLQRSAQWVRVKSRST